MPPHRQMRWQTGLQSLRMSAHATFHRQGPRTSVPAHSLPQSHTVHCLSCTWVGCQKPRRRRGRAPPEPAAGSGITAWHYPRWCGFRTGPKPRVSFCRLRQSSDYGWWQECAGTRKSKLSKTKADVMTKLLYFQKLVARIKTIGSNRKHPEQSRRAWQARDKVPELTEGLFSDRTSLDRIVA